MKNIIKSLIPPIILDTVKRIVRKPKTYTAVWNTFLYDPMQGVLMYFDPTGPWQAKLLSSEYDNYIFQRLAKMNLKDKVIFDIGAHIGFHTFYFARLVGLKGKVHAFEPHPKNVERIRIQLEKNPDLKKVISVHDIALSDKESTEIFTLNNNIESGRSSGGFIASADTIWEKEAFTCRDFIDTTVKTFPLDQMAKLGIESKPDVLKIDVEYVLRGAKETIAKYKPFIFIEAHSIKAMFDVMKFFSEVSYTSEVIFEEKDGRCFLEARHSK